jgi:hypothetical protein
MGLPQIVFGNSERATSTSHAAAYQAFKGKLWELVEKGVPPEGNIPTLHPYIDW